MCVCVFGDGEGSPPLSKQQTVKLHLCPVTDTVIYELRACSAGSLCELEVAGGEVWTQLLAEQPGAGPALAGERLALADAVTSQAPPAISNGQVGIRRCFLLRRAVIKRRFQV